ncbi:hypothetical protein BRADI_4g18881v3 [Brachypodium distachyon]|uniref:Uncharacterized protein n=1 Tax=Brachypodium distachyon TaxID=15368 RepID=A0A0Q3ELQ7_BRADI|nr:hypothetical protein BRADI_4g18881v3 [Brachypodium distachyon]
MMRSIFVALIRGFQNTKTTTPSREKMDRLILVDPSLPSTKTTTPSGEKMDRLNLVNSSLPKNDSTLTREDGPSNSCKFITSEKRQHPQKRKWAI